MAQFCTHCGKEVADGATVCMNCGCPIPQKPVAKQKQNSNVQLSLVLGIIGMVAAWLFALIGHITSIIGIIIGVREYKETNNELGLVLSIVGELFSILSSIIGAITLSGLFFFHSASTFLLVKRCDVRHNIRHHTFRFIEKQYYRLNQRLRPNCLLQHLTVCSVLLLQTPQPLASTRSHPFPN